MLELHKDDFTKEELRDVEEVIKYYQRLRLVFNLPLLDPIGLYHQVLMAYKKHGFLIKDVLQASEDVFLSEMYKVALCMSGYDGEFFQGEELVFKKGTVH